MSRILCTFPGRAGDLLWALPTCRAIAETTGDPVDLLIAGEFAGMVPLLEEGAPYLGRVTADPDWSLTPPDEWNPRLDLRAYPHDRIVHLGYRGWPSRALPRFIHLQAEAEYPDLPIAPLDLDHPWLTVTGAAPPCTIACGFTEAHFELKYGLLTLIGGDDCLQLTPRGSRWRTEHVPATVAIHECDWLDAARVIRNADLFFGDCSALHVLACALGKPVVLMEPMEARHNPIFYPYGTHGRVRLVRGGTDGLPTFDARHVRDALESALKECVR